MTTQSARSLTETAETLAKRFERLLQQDLANARAGYHEPYYKGYLRDDLSAMLGECGFEVVSAEPFLVSKVVVARKAE
jgi:hypothetical protein